MRLQYFVTKADSGEQVLIAMEPAMKNDLEATKNGWPAIFRCFQIVLHSRFHCNQNLFPGIRFGYKILKPHPLSPFLLF